MVKASGIRAWIARTFFYDLYWAWTSDTRPGRGRRFALQAVLTIAAIGALGAGAMRWPDKANTLIEAIDEADYWVTLGCMAVLAVVLAVAVGHANRNPK